MRKVMINKIKDDITYYLTILLSLGIFIWGVFFTDNFERVFSGALEFVTTNFSWYFMILMVLFLVACIYLATGKYKNIKLGSDDSEPEFSKISWFAMLFSSGIGIGLVFWGVAEPLTHYLEPLGMEGGTKASTAFAFRKSFLHWGLSAWGCYAILALVIAYMHFRKGKPILISSVLIPIIGEKNAKGLVGKIIDTLTIFVTIAGIITSLGMGTVQINSGLNYLFGVPENIFIQVGIIVVITVLFLISATTGVKKGIKILSNLNLGIAMLLLFVAFLIVPKMDLFNNMTVGLAQYGEALFTDNLNILASGPWYDKWTIFYWGWWIAWAPAVAIFIARISKGRTIKEFVQGVLLVPSGVCLIWFGVFGTLGISSSESIAIEAIKDVETTLFVVFSQYKMGSVLSIIAVILLFTFFITSADSATYVLSVIASGGELAPKNSRKIVIGILQSLLTVALLFAGGLGMIQTASVVMSFPFGIIITATIISLVKELRQEDLDTVNSMVRKKEKKTILPGAIPESIGSESL